MANNQRGNNNQSSRGQNSGNFKNDPERAREAGKKGGEASRGSNR